MGMTPKPTRTRQIDYAWSIGLFLLTVFSRLPFQTEILYHWDSVNFAYAMREFDVAKEQPQPPGYIIYVWLCRLVDHAFGDPNKTMIAISIVSSALAVVAMYWLGKAMFRRRTGVISALFMWSSPLFWFYGEIALPHALDALLITVGAWWLYETIQGKARFLYPAIVLLSIAGGVRQQTLVFMAPLILFALWRVGWKRFFAAGMLGAVLCLAWFIPLMASSGGVASYFGAVGRYNEHFQATTSLLMGAGWFGLQRNLTKLSLYTGYGWGFAGFLAIGEGVRRLLRRELPSSWRKLAFLALWVAPTVVYYAFIHMGQQGLVFVFLPVLLLVSAHAVDRCFTSLDRAQLAWWVGGAVAVASLCVFCFAPEYPLGGDRVRLLTRSTLTQSDRYYGDRFSAVESRLAPESTAILAENWHHVEYYLPEYKTIPFDVVAKWEKGEGNPTGSPRSSAVTPAELGLEVDERGHAAIVVFDSGLMGFSQSSVPAEELYLEHGGILEFFVLSEDQVFHFGAGSFGIVEE